MATGLLVLAGLAVPTGGGGHSRAAMRAGRAVADPTTTTVPRRPAAHPGGSAPHAGDGTGPGGRGGVAGSPGTGPGAVTTSTAGAEHELAPTGAGVRGPVLVIGDSLGIDVGYQLIDHLQGGGTTVDMDAVGDTGLANVGFYNWPAQLATLLASTHPALVVVFMGANDDQGLYVGTTPEPPGSAAWDTAYAGRVRQLLTEATGSGADVVWVGMPPMQDPDLNAWMQHVNGLDARQVARVHRALYVPSAPVLGTATGGYQVSSGGPDPVVLRTPDGVHLTPDGASLLAQAVIGAVQHRWPQGA